MRFAFCLGVAFLAVNAARAQDGAIDLRFAAGKGASDDIYDLAPSGGGFLVAGHFTSFGERDRWRLARLHADGSLDETFDPKDSTGSAPITRLAPLADGAALIAGPFSRFDGKPCRLVGRLKADGALDPAFDANDSFGRSGGAVQALVSLPDGKTLVAGRFDSPAKNGKTRGIVRLLPDGSIDDSFIAGIRVTGEGEVINAIAPLPGGKLLIAGQFSPAGNIARLEANGALDPTFHLTDHDGTVSAMALQPDGKIVAALAKRVARLLADGAPDPEFHSDALAASEEDSRIEAVVLQPDGAIVVGGRFHRWAGVRREGIARLKSDGSLDLTFDPAAGIAVLPLDDPDEAPDATVRALLPLPEGRLLIAGRFDLYNGAPSHNIVRVFNGAH